MPLFRWDDYPISSQQMFTTRAASHLGQRAQMVKKAQKRSRTQEHIKRLRADIDARLIASGAQPRTWKPLEGNK